MISHLLDFFFFSKGKVKENVKSLLLCHCARFIYVAE